MHKFEHLVQPGVIQPLEEALQYLAEQRGVGLADAIKPILFTNLKKGRIHNFIDGSQTENSVAAYVCRVADNYEANHAYVAAVQQARSHDVWEPLYIQLQKWAYNYLKRSRFPAQPNVHERQEHAQICAHEAAASLLTAAFPYDTEFGRWAYVLLQNMSRQYMNRQINPRSVETAVELDAWEDWLNNIIDPEGETKQQQLMLRQDLNHALNQLSSDARRQFIKLYYFEHLTFPEIARRLDRKENALYKLHHDALKNLRKIFHENDHTYG